MVRTTRVLDSGRFSETGKFSKRYNFGTWLFLPQITLYSDSPSRTERNDTKTSFLKKCDSGRSSPEGFMCMHVA